VSGIILIALAGVAALMFYLWQNELDLCARLLGVAAVGLNQNPSLIFFVLVCKLGMTFIILPIFGLIFASFTNGRVVPNGARQGGARCVDQEGQSVPCCAWKADPWVGVYMSLASVTMLWTIFVVGQLRVYVLSGTIAQWYFAPPDNPGGTKGTTMRSVRHALGPSFGTLSFGAAVLTLVQLARNAMEQARQSNGSDGMAVFLSLLSFFLECVYTLIEYLTKFATIMAAITGEAFLVAGRRSTDLLKRNFLKSYGVWFLPPLILQSAALVLGMLWGFLVFLLYWLSSHTNRSHGTQEAAILGAISFFVAWVVLSFFSSILLDIVDATYLCYAIDKDTQTITKPDVHEIYSKMPVGAAVENPDGEVLVGAPQSHPHSYVPPSHPSAAQNFHDSSARV